MQKHAPNPYGTYRVISPKGVLPQPADVIDNNMEIWDNEVLIDVQTLNIDSASFTEIVKRVLNKKPAEVTTKEEMEAIGNKMKEIVAHAGKHKNPWTGSGGMLMGTVEQVGDNYVGDLKPGDKIATLVSLSLTPLRIDEILEMRPAIDQVDIKGKAILFQSGIYAKLPDDMPAGTALSALDVAGAPAQAGPVRSEGPGHRRRRQVRSALPVRSKEESRRYRSRSLRCRFPEVRRQSQKSGSR